MSIYKPCSIRGDAATEVTPELYRRWGYTLGQWVEPSSKFVAGGDVRGSTPSRLAALVEGLCLAGVDCVDLGQLPTPMIYHAKRRLRAAGCAIVTASHQPAPVNGLTWLVGDRPPSPEQVASLETGAQRPAAACPDRPGSSPRTLDVSYDYVAWLQETWCEALRAQYHIVLDPMHGCWSGRARRYLHAIFPESLITVIRDSSDPTFGGVCPDCAHPDNLHELCEAVYRHRAHVGIAMDGDGDRVALVDGHGIPLTAEETTWVLLQSFGRELRGQAFVYDANFSDRIPEAARRLGAEPVAERSDHASLLARMQQTGAVFGAQIDGHYFFADLAGADDSLFAACRAITHLCRSGKTLARLRRRCPRTFITPNLRLQFASGSEQRLFERIRAEWSQFPQTVLDGVRIDLPGGWAMVRNPDGEGDLSFRFEASDWPTLDDLVRLFCDALPECGPELWGLYHEWAVGSGA